MLSFVSGGLFMLALVTVLHVMRADARRDARRLRAARIAAVCGMALLVCCMGAGAVEARGHGGGSHHGHSSHGRH